MKIEILEREFKKDKLELRQIDFCHLLAIRNKHSNLWEQLKEFIDIIDKVVLE